jgi:hypothetical protein
MNSEVTAETKRVGKVKDKEMAGRSGGHDIGRVSSRIVSGNPKLSRRGRNQLAWITAALAALSAGLVGVVQFSLGVTIIDPSFFNIFSASSKMASLAPLPKTVALLLG